MAKNTNGGDGIKAWAENVIEEVKKAFGIGSGKSPMRDEVGKVLSSQLGDGLKKNSKAALNAFKTVKAEIDYERKLDLLSDEEYYIKLEDLRDQYFQKGSENWVKYSAEIYAYQKELLENETKNLTQIYDTVSEYADARFNEIRKKQAALTKELIDFGGISTKNTVNINGKKDTYYSTRDIKNDIESVKAYSSRLLELKNILKDSNVADFGINSFLDEINSMGVAEGLSFMNSLMAQGKSSAVAYAELWTEKVSISESIGKELLKDELNAATEEVVLSLKTALEEAGYEIPEGFFESGKMSAANFGKAFLAELDAQLSEIRAKIMEFSTSLSVNQGMGNIYNSTTNQYNIASAGAEDTVEQIRRYDTVKRLMGA